MKLHTVTFTGVDGWTDVYRMLEIQKRYPFVEWGILVPKNSGNEVRGTRFPPYNFILNLPEKLRLSLHVCDPVVGNLARGMSSYFVHGLIGRLQNIQRVQINTHAQEYAWHEEWIGTLSEIGRPIIFQFDGVNNDKFVTAYNSGLDCYGLFDLSHGAGVTPTEWVTIRSSGKGGVTSIVNRFGYSGGLGPDNLSTELPRIAEAAGDVSTWIDMETRVRTNGDFDLDKVERCIEIALPWVD